MKTNTLISGAIFFALLFSCKSNEKEKKDIELYEPINVTEVINPAERGKYLVDTNGCHDCHSPKKFTEKGIELDPDRLLSGHPADEKLAPYDQKTAQAYILFTMGLTSATGPWGTSFSANLTPDATGLGSWTEDQFLTCIKKGLYKGLEGSRPLLPPMPWEHYKNFTDDDLKAVFAYLKTIRPVENLVPAAIPPTM